jgi:hypothetical protein
MGAPVSGIDESARSQQRIDDLGTRMRGARPQESDCRRASLCPRTVAPSVSLSAAGASRLRAKTSAAACKGVSQWLVSVPWPKFLELTSAPAMMSRRAVAAAAVDAARQAMNKGVFGL